MHNKIVERLNQQRKAKAHVRQAVLESGAVIFEARAAGNSLHGIYRALKAEGLSVGSGPSSFYASVKWLDQNGWGEVTSRSAGHVVSPVSVQPDPAVPAEPERHSLPPEPALAKPASGFTDNRFGTDFA